VTLISELTFDPSSLFANAILEVSRASAADLKPSRT
jgi:hypothetical protein